MDTQPALESLLDRVEPERRRMLRTILLGAAAGGAVYSAPVVLSFSMDSLGGVAQAQVSNQVATPVPTNSPLGLAATVAALGTAGALLLRRRDKR